MSKNKYEDDIEPEDYRECDCCCSDKSKIIKIGACIGGIAILGGIITAIVLKRRKSDY